MHPRITRCAPYFPVADVQRTLHYYQTVLGFGSEYEGGSPPEFAIISRDGHALMLRVVDDPGAITPTEKQGGTWDAFFWVEGVRDLHAELSGRGAEVVYGPVVQEAYGMEEFAVRDPDDHVLGFGEAVA